MDIVARCPCCGEPIYEEEAEAHDLIRDGETAEMQCTKCENIFTLIKAMEIVIYLFSNIFIIGKS